MNIKIAERDNLEIQFLLDEQDTLWFRVVTANQTPVDPVGGFMEIFKEVEKYDSALDWVVQVVIPECNKLLARHFGKDDSPELDPNDLISVLRAIKYDAVSNELKL